MGQIGEPEKIWEIPVPEKVPDYMPEPVKEPAVVPATPRKEEQPV